MIHMHVFMYWFFSTQQNPAIWQYLEVSMFSSFYQVNSFFSLWEQIKKETETDRKLPARALYKYRAFMEETNFIQADPETFLASIQSLFM